MAFVDITNRLVEILTDNQALLLTDTNQRDIVIQATYPEDHYAECVCFVWRDSLSQIDYGQFAGEGLTAVGEIDGMANWKVAMYVRVPGNEAEAANDLSLLAWNLLRVLRGFRRESVNPQWGSMLVKRSTARMLNGNTGGWYLGEEFDLEVGWSIQF